MTFAMKIAVKDVVRLYGVLDSWQRIELFEFSENLNWIQRGTHRLSADHALEKGVLLTTQLITLLGCKEHGVLQKSAEVFGDSFSDEFLSLCWLYKSKIFELDVHRAYF